MTLTDLIIDWIEEKYNNNLWVRQIREPGIKADVISSKGNEIICIYYFYHKPREEIKQGYKIFCKLHHWKSASSWLHPADPELFQKLESYLNHIYDIN